MNTDSNNEPKLRILGLMSGTSLDGLDLCLCDVSGPNWPQFQQRAFVTRPMPAKLRQQILRNLNPESSQVNELCQLNAQLAAWFAAEVEDFLDRQHLSPESLDLIASHGQTVWHQPPELTVNGPQAGSSLQLGDGSWLAQQSGITTVSNFRAADMAAGGQGAPLVPFLDQLLFRHPSQNRVLLNLGGMANLTWLPSSGLVQAFDTGPGNVLIDGLCRELTGALMDRDGTLAGSAQACQPLLQSWLQHPFFAQTPPRSTGRESFGAQFLQQILRDTQERGLNAAEALATVTSFTAQSILQACRDFLPSPADEIWVSGGGLHNLTLMQELQAGFAPAPVRSLADLGWDPDAKEALAFACMAFFTLLGRPGNLPSVTGAAQNAVLGQIAPGKNWLNLLKKIEVIHEAFLPVPDCAPIAGL